jgi:hypothetical protein
MFILEARHAGYNPARIAIATGKARENTIKLAEKTGVKEAAANGLGPPGPPPPEGGRNLKKGRLPPRRNDSNTPAMVPKMLPKMPVIAASVRKRDNICWGL